MSSSDHGYKRVMPLRQKNRTEAARDLAKAARKRASVAEEIVWKFLRNSRLGFKFRREYAVLDYRLDFYCAEARLGVELDGEQHDEARDSERDARLGAIGIEVMRIPNRAFFMLDGQAPVDWLNLIRARCEELTGRCGTPFEL